MLVQCVSYSELRLTDEIGMLVQNLKKGEQTPRMKVAREKAGDIDRRLSLLTSL